MSYIEFLKPYALKKQIWRYGNDMIHLLKHSLSEMPAEVIMGPPKGGLDGIMIKVRQKVLNNTVFYVLLLLSFNFFFFYILIYFVD